MNDFDSDPLDPLDDLASAALDGMTPPEVGDLDPVRARALAERVARLGRVRARLAEPVPSPSDDERDRMIARAIAVGTDAATVDAHDPVASDAAATTAPMSLDHHRARRAIRVRRFAPLAAAAAVLLLAAIVTPALLGSDDGDLASSAPEAADVVTEPGADADARSAAPPVGAGEGDTGPAFGAEALAPEDADDTPTASAEGDLEVPEPAPADSADGSSFVYAGGSDEALLDAVRRFRASEGAGGSLAITGDDPCTAVVGHPIDWAVTGTYRSQPAVFFVQLDRSAVLAVTVLDEGCNLLAEVVGGP